VIDLTLSKDDGGITTTPGGLVIYTLTYANIGNRAATGVVIEETLPANSTFDVSNSDPGWICTNPPACTNYQLSIGPLGAAPAGGTAAFAVVVDNPLASGVTQIDNAATIYDDGTNGDEADLTNNDAADFTPVDAAPTLLITKDDHITQTAAGATLVYDIVLTNNGDQHATGVFITDTIPVELENPAVLSITRSDGIPAPDYEITGGDTLRVPSGAGTFDLPVGTTITVRLQVDVKDPVPGDPPYFTNLAHAEDDGSNTGGVPVVAEDDDTDALRDLTKSLVAMSHHDPALGRDVYIGELLTYEASFVIAPGQLDNLHLVDTMDAGLAVVYCESITAVPGTGIVEDPAHPFNNNAGSTAVCPGVANLASTSFTPSPLNDPDQAGDARIVDFNFGIVQNTGAVDETITVRYVVAVLDTARNVRGVALENTALWTWTGNTGGLQQTAGLVTILEPTLTITKDVDRTTALPGSVVTFTVVIANDGVGTNSDAFDVTMTDVLPSTLIYVPLSMTFAGYPVTSWSDAAPTLTATWAVLPIGESATITFQATVNLRPGRSATNTAAVEWSSLPGDFTAPQSPFNRFSTERYYDPNDPVNIYGGAASIAVQAPELPATGFAPGRVTALPDQPDGKSYASIDEFRLMIPALGVDIPIVGVPAGAEGWDITWLRGQAGYLAGTAYPTWNGNSGITAHVYDADGNPGPFVDLQKLKWGDVIIVQSFGQKYVYVVREVIRTYAEDLSVLRHEEKPWLTLITCQGFNEQTGLYIWRIAVRAEFARVE
jgi:LPXTG-site transpeptidase (sortase) family protein